jgi:ATP-dependent NAD(P)H-hydrate dehydratase
MASLRAGSDLSYVLTAREAAPTVKSYSPELMVVPVYSAEAMDGLAAAAEEGGASEAESAAAVDAAVRAVEPWLDRLHCLVLGPGLGRCPLVMEAAYRVVQIARSKNLVLVLDADALFMLSLYPAAVAGYARAVLTPNAVEHARLVENGVDLTGVTVVRKGRVDEIAVSRNGTAASSASEDALVCREPGGLKRSGGIGDVLAGTLGTLLAWQVISHEPSPRQSSEEPSPSVPAHKEAEAEPRDTDDGDDWRLACWTGCCLVRRATRRAYERHGRSMTAPDVLAELGAAVRSFENRDEEERGDDGGEEE